MFDTLTMTRALVELDGRDDLPALAAALQFAIECHAMIGSLEAASFPLPDGVQVTLAGVSPVGDLVLTESTARILHAALGSALGVPAPNRLASE